MVDDLLSHTQGPEFDPYYSEEKKMVPKSKGTVANNTDTPERTGSLENLVKMMP